MVSLPIRWDVGDDDRCRSSGRSGSGLRVFHVDVGIAGERELRSGQNDSHAGCGLVQFACANDIRITAGRRSDRENVGRGRVECRGNANQSLDEKRTGRDAPDLDGIGCADTDRIVSDVFADEMNVL